MTDSSNVNTKDNVINSADEIAKAKEKKHIERQKKIKANVDERVAKATEERGVFVIITGNGKGKVLLVLVLYYGLLAMAKKQV